jgi:hypothetical protein
MIKQALRPRRRRQLAILAATALIAVIVGSRNGHGPASRSRPGAALRVMTSPAAVFAQDPYMGVSCHIPNSIACDRVGLSVWLGRPATVTATIAGAPLRLTDPAWSYVAHQGGKPLYVYAGFVRPAGITTRLRVTRIGGTVWLGAYAPAPVVDFRIDYGHGNVVVTQAHVLLHAGWG